MQSQIGKDHFTMRNFLGIGDLVLRAGTVFAEGAQVHRVNADGSTSQEPPPDMLHLIGTVLTQNPKSTCISALIAHWAW